MRLRTFLIIGSFILTLLFIFILDVNIVQAGSPISCTGPGGTVTEWTDGECCHIHKNGCWFRNRGSYIEGHVRAAYKSWGVCQYRRKDGNVWNCGGGAWQCVSDPYCWNNDRWERVTCTKGRAVGSEWGESRSELCWGWSLDARSYPSWGAHCEQSSFTEYRFVQDCGEDSWSNNYRCSGNTRQRWWIDRGCYDGGNWTGCYDDRGWWRNWENCGSTSYGGWGYYCSGDSRYRRRTVYNRGCSGSSCYYYTSTQTEYVEYCGGGYWTNDYRCSGRYRQRLYKHGGCDGGSCYTWNEWKTVEDCGTSGWTNEYRCSGRNRQRKWINRGCSGSSCYANSQWKNVQDCGVTSYGSWTFYCSNNDKWKKRTVYNRGCSGSSCYYYTSTQNEFVEDCGDITCGAWYSWYCDGNTRKRKRTCTGGYCENETCKSGSYTDYETEDCGSDYWTDEYQCSDNIRQRKYVHRGCSDGSCYNWTEWKDIEDCESTSYGPWANYCSSDDVWKKRTITHGFCSGGSCTTNTSTQNEFVEDCGESSWADPAEYQCSGSWKQRKWINRGCLDASCYATPEWKNDQNCAETCFPGVLGEGCEGGTYSCIDDECTYPIGQCVPRQFTPQGTVCECNERRKTILRACDGTGLCVNVEEVCHIDCGSDPACHGKKPGDPYPGKPGRICCEGWGLPKWREIVPW